jgi:hypothetical protein
VKVFSFPLLIARSSTVPDTDALMSLLKNNKNKARYQVNCMS